MTYELDSTHDEAAPNGTDDGTISDGTNDQFIGVTIPDDHVGAFVAEALEDPERSTSWEEVVETMVAPPARDDWHELGGVQRAAAVLSKASEFDQSAVDYFDDVPLDVDGPAVRSALDEGLRCRRNADAFRNGVAAAYGDGMLDDDELVAALEAAEFDVDLIERREELLERIDDVYDVSFRPYGGTLMDTDDQDGDREGDLDHAETW